jgi:hypothetical protein
MTEAPQKAGGKGRPTPKRSEAQKARKQPLVTPKGGASRSGRSKSDNAALRATMREAMRTGDERNYPPIAAGPERALVRDVIDARQGFGWLAIPGWVVGVTLTLVPVQAARAAGSLLFPVVIVVIVVDAFVAARAVRRALAERWPEGTQAPRKSLVWYGIARNTQFRRSRLPRPRVGPGTPAP